MNSFQSNLFLGFLIDTSFQDQLQNLDPELKSLYIQNYHDAYLSLYSLKESHYLGKYLENGSNLKLLEATSLNICSLLKKMIPDHSIDKEELFIIPVMKE